MSRSALVIGYGSIGRRHAGILREMDEIGDVTVLSSQSNLPFRTIRNIDEVGTIDPDYIVIASNTALHYKHLVYLENKFSNKTILVEKPLFERAYEFTPVNNTVWVAYVLRAHPILQLIKKTAGTKNIWSIHAFCGSYLPDWRPGRDYKETSSAKVESGGGVMLDLSHELDYVQWIAGRIEIDYVCSERVSTLEIETDDLLMLNGHTENGTKVQINLNYFTRNPKREILIDGEDISIQADLINNCVRIHLDGKVQTYSYEDNEMNDIFREEHKAVLAGNSEMACSCQEGLATMNLIERIKTFGQ